MTTLLNSNFLDPQGLQITEGCVVYRTDPDNYKNNGRFIVDCCNEDTVSLVDMNGNAVNYNLAYPNELMVMVRG